MLTEQGKATILVVDDTEAWQERFGTLLKEAGYGVAAASSLREAESLIEQRRFDVAVVDLVLSDVDESNRDGVAIVSTLRDIGEFTETIIVSGYATVHLARDLLRTYNCSDLIEKQSFDIPTFLASVRDAASRSRLIQIRFESATKLLLFPEEELHDVIGHIALSAPEHNSPKQPELERMAIRVVQRLLYGLAPLRPIQGPAKRFICSHGFSSFQGHLWSRGIGNEVCVWFGLSDHIPRDRDEFEARMRLERRGSQALFRLLREHAEESIAGRAYLIEGR